MAVTLNSNGEFWFPSSEDSPAEFTHPLTRPYSLPPDFDKVWALSRLAARRIPSPSGWDVMMHATEAAGHVASNYTIDTLLSHQLSRLNQFELERREELLLLLRQQCFLSQQKKIMMMMCQNRGNRGLDVNETMGRYTGPPRLDLAQSTRPVHRNPPPRGTGVFIPRGYGCSDPSPPEPPRKRETGYSIPPLSSRVVHDLNRNLENMTNQMLEAKRCFNDSFDLEHDLLVARRTTSMSHLHKYSPNLRSVEAMNNLESCLPQDWTY